MGKWWKLGFNLGEPWARGAPVDFSGTPWMLCTAGYLQHSPELMASWENITGND